MEMWKGGVLDVGTSSSMWKRERTFDVCLFVVDDESFSHQPIFELRLLLEEMPLLAAETLLGGCTIANKHAQNIAADPIYIYFPRAVFECLFGIQTSKF